jgi:hypothetical protein
MIILPTLERKIQFLPPSSKSESTPDIYDAYIYLILNLTIFGTNFLCTDDDCNHAPSVITAVAIANSL